MNKDHIFNFINLLRNLADEKLVQGVPMSYIYLNEFRELKKIVAYYYSVTKDSY